MTRVHQSQFEALHAAEQVSLAVPPSDSYADVYRAFEAYCKYVIHEDVLIGDRLQRLLTIQGLLFAAEATLLPKLGDLLPLLHNNPAELRITHVRLLLCGLLAVIIPIMGALSAHFVLPALKAAREAIQELNSVWIDLWGIEASRCKLPRLIGGGAPASDKNGHKHILHIARCFRESWLFFFCALLASILWLYLHVLHNFI